MAFTGTCQRNHDRIDFTDGETFEEHFATVHGKRKPRAPKPAKPYAWKPAARNPKMLEAWVKSGDLAIGDVAAGDWERHGYVGAIEQAA